MWKYLLEDHSVIQPDLNVYVCVTFAWAMILHTDVCFLPAWFLDVFETKASFLQSYLVGHRYFPLL